MWRQGAQDPLPVPLDSLSSTSYYISYMMTQQKQQLAHERNLLQYMSTGGLPLAGYGYRAEWDIAPGAGPVMVEGVVVACVIDDRDGTWYRRLGAYALS